ncbi:hypothetical protein ACEXQB_007480 [Herbiconiux sp. P18]|uniref:hypothetical protein n=1 Tax=Herbiconiux liangxiaofengii TaxID=3342795 RepID=UPI0035B81040
MESESERMRANDQSAQAREALDALHADRQVLADRISTPRWYYPLLGVATALIIGSPGGGLPGQFVMVTFGCLGIVFLTMAYQKATGLTVTRTAGPRSLGLSIVLGIVVVLLLGVSFSLAATGHSAWIAASSAAAFAVMWGGGVLYDRAYDRELRHGR